MLFSVIIPIYNVKDFLHKCIDSVLSQNFDDYELGLVSIEFGDKVEVVESYLPTSEITADVETALKAGAAGAVIFRWGVTNLVAFRQN